MILLYTFISQKEHNLTSLLESALEKNQMDPITERGANVSFDVAIDMLSSMFTDWDR